MNGSCVWGDNEAYDATHDIRELRPNESLVGGYGGAGLHRRIEPQTALPVQRWRSTAEYPSLDKETFVARRLTFNRHEY